MDLDCSQQQMLVGTTTKGFCLPVVTSLNSFSLRHIRLSRCKALLIARINLTRTFALALSSSCVLAHSLFHWRGALGHLVPDQRCINGWFGVNLQPRGARVDPRPPGWPQSGVEPASASCILVRAWAYRCTICLTCSSSSRCRMRRKFFSSGMEKACHWRKRPGKINKPKTINIGVFIRY